MKPRVPVLLLAGFAGLVCGFLVRSRPAPAAGPVAETRRAGVTATGASAAPDSKSAKEWEARLARYLAAPLPAPASRGSLGPRAETTGLLRMALLPVNAETIREGIALLNATGLSRYSGIIPSIFERWAREAPEAALAAAGGLRDSRIKMALVWKVFETAAAAKDPDLLAKAGAQPVGVSRSAAFAAIADSVPVEGIPEMLRRSLTGKPSPYMAGASFQLQLLTKLAQSDKSAPLRLALETENPAWRAGLLQTSLMMGGDEKSDPLPTLARDPRNVEGLMYHMANRLRYSTAEGLKMIADWPEANRQRLFRKVFEGAFERLPKGVFRPAMEIGNLEILISEIQHKEGAEGFRSLLAESALSRGTQGLDETAAWMLSRHDAAGLEDLTRRAALAEPFTTARWLAAMPPSAERDRAVAVFAETHAATDPERAAVWAESIADPAKRAATLTAVRRH
ncbi:MAG: hypothetical protein V4726_22660 [Verrucomicrobiota bacterium]